MKKSPFFRDPFTDSRYNKNNNKPEAKKISEKTPLIELQTSYRLQQPGLVNKPKQSKKPILPRLFDNEQATKDQLYDTNPFFQASPNPLKSQKPTPESYLGYQYNESPSEKYIESNVWFPKYIRNRLHLITLEDASSKFILFSLLFPILLLIIIFTLHNLIPISSISMEYPSCLESSIQTMRCEIIEKSIIWNIQDINILDISDQYLVFKNISSYPKLDLLVQEITYSNSTMVQELHPLSKLVIYPERMNISDIYYPLAITSLLTFRKKLDNSNISLNITLLNSESTFYLELPSVTFEIQLFSSFFKIVENGVLITILFILVYLLYLSFSKLKAASNYIKDHISRDFPSVIEITKQFSNNFNLILPEQFSTISCLFFLAIQIICLLISRNFYYIVDELGYSSEWAESSLMAISALFLISKLSILFILLCFIDGLHYNSNRFEEQTSLSYFQEDGIKISSPNELLRYKELLQYLYSTFWTKHHPSSTQFLDFFVPKFFLFFFSCLLIGIELFISSLLSSQSSQLNNSCNFFMIPCDLWQRTIQILVLICYLIWIIQILMTFLKSASSLRRTRYIQSRIRQVIFKLFYMQVIIGGIFTSVYFILTLVYFRPVINLYALSKSLNFTVEWAKYFFPWFLFSDESILSYKTDYLLLYFTFMVISLSLAIHPPNELGSKEKKDLASKYYSLRQHLLAEKSLYIKETKYLAPFCLETACILLEASYQSYFSSAHLGFLNNEIIPESPLSPSSSSLSAFQGPKLDLSNLGLTLHNVFYNPTWSTFGFVSQSSSEIVVAFRGSTLANIATDFAFSQIALPNLKRPKSYFIHLLILEDEELNPCENNLNIDLEDSLLYNDLEASRLTNEILGEIPEHNISPDSSLSEKQKLSEMLYSNLTQCASYLPILNQSFPRVHIGFWQAYSSIRDKYIADLVILLFQKYKIWLSKNFNEKDFKTKLGREIQPDSNIHENIINLNITGHSLGGAMAILAATEIAINMKSIFQVFEILFQRNQYNNYQLEVQGKLPLPILQVYVFGCPRVGNISFVNLVQKLIPNFYRIQVDGDIVTMVPKLLGFYRHVGTLVLLDEEANGNILLKPTVLEDSFFRRVIGNLPNHSLETYRRCLEACFEPEEYQNYLANEYKYSNTQHKEV